MKKWWARVAVGNGYGTTMPTGCASFEAASDYMRFYIPRYLDREARVIEWLQL